MNTTFFEAWAPEGAPWSPWAKPVLFADASPIPSGAADRWEAARSRARELWAPTAMGDTALVLDLAGPVALALSLDCAARGWRPVPLFNSCAGQDAILDNELIRVGLKESAELLSRLDLPSTAPPAFVLDSRRMGGDPAPKRFDNRWLVFPQDFPSAARLLASGVRRVCLVQEDRTEVRRDLAHVLLRWQRAGLEMLALSLPSTTPPTPLVVPVPSRFHALGYRILIALGFRKSSAGGFGGIVPWASGGGGAMWA